MKKWIYLTSTMLMYHIPLLAEDELPARDQGVWQTAIMIGIFLVFFYFILFRPEQKRRRAAEELRAQIKKGDRVTAMGILGTVIRVHENTIVLKMYDGSKIEMLKAAVSDVVAGSDDDRKKAEKEDVES